MRNKRLALLFLVLILSSSIAFAFELQLDRALGNIGREIEQLIRNSNFRFGLVFILFFMIMYGIYSSAINRISIFSGETRYGSTGDQPNKQGKIISVSLALITAVGLAYYASYSGRVFTDRILEWAGWFGAIAFGALIGLIAHVNTDSSRRDWKRTIALISLGLMTYSTILGDVNGAATWFSLLAVFGLWYLIQEYNDRSPESGGSGSSGNRATGGGSGGQSANRPRTSISSVQNFNATPTPAGIQINWDANPATENIQAYHLQRTSRRGRWRFRSEQSWRFPGNQTTYMDAVNAFGEIDYRIRAINSNGNAGPWSYARARIGNVSINGRVVFDDGNQYPIDNVLVRISDPAGSNRYHASTNSRGEFHIPNVPNLQASPLNLDIIDNVSGGPVFQISFPNSLRLDNVNTANVNIGALVTGAASGEPIRLLPLAGPRSTLRFQAQRPDGTNYTDPLYVCAIGKFRRMTFQSLPQASNGYYILNNLPSGYSVRLVIAPANGSYPTTITAPIFLRNPNHSSNIPYDLPLVRFNAMGQATLSGRAINIRNNRPISLVVVSAAGTGANYSSRVTSASGQYQIDDMNTGTYTIDAVHAKDNFMLPAPIQNYMVLGPGQNLDVIMIPTFPMPRDIAAVVDNNGNIQFTVNL